MPAPSPELEMEDLGGRQGGDKDESGQNFATPKVPSNEFSSISSFEVKTPTIIITPNSTPNKSNNEFAVTPLKGN